MVTARLSSESQVGYEIRVNSLTRLEKLDIVKTQQLGVTMKIDYHYLKTVQPFFNHVMYSNKGFEVRKHDRDFKVGDIVVLEEYDPESNSYSGYKTSRHIMYILRHGDYPEGIQQGYCVLGLG